MPISPETATKAIWFFIGSGAAAVLAIGTWIGVVQTTLQTHDSKFAHDGMAEYVRTTLIAESTELRIEVKQVKEAVRSLRGDVRQLRNELRDQRSSK